MELKTIREMASALNEQANRVRYMALKYGIEPVRKAGTAGLYSDAQMALIKEYLLDLKVSRGY